MKHKTVIYTNLDGTREVRRVPDGLPTQDLEGVFVGPPDLFELPLNEDTIKTLNNRLVEADFITYEDLQGKRRHLLELVQSIEQIEDPNFIRREVIRIYQREYYPELFEDIP